MPDRKALIADEVPWSDRITPYDEQHHVAYLRILDAERAGADWREVAEIVLCRDPVADPEGSHRCWESHLKRAQWMTKTGYRKLVTGDRDTLQ